MGASWASGPQDAPTQEGWCQWVSLGDTSERSKICFLVSSQLLMLKPTCSWWPSLIAFVSLLGSIWCCTHVKISKGCNDFVKWKIQRSYMSTFWSWLSGGRNVNIIDTVWLDEVVSSKIQILVCISWAIYPTKAQKWMDFGQTHASWPH